MYNYMITIRHPSKLVHVSYDQLYRVYRWIKHIHNFKLKNATFEKGHLYNQRHLHLVVGSYDPLHYRGSTRFNEYRIRYDPLYTASDLHNAQIYCAKDKYEHFTFEAADREAGAVPDAGASRE